MIRMGALRSAFAGAALAAIIVAGSAAYAPAQTSDIPWNSTLVISRTSTNDDIRNVLRSILQANGLSAVFGPGVEGPISFQLDRVPVDAAFQQLIDRYNLSFTYDPTTRTVMITSEAGQDEFAQEEVSLTLDQESFDQLSQALISLGLGVGGVAYDALSGTVTITGDRNRVDRIIGLVTTMRPELADDLAAQLGGAAEVVEAPPPPPPPPAPAPVELEPIEVEVIPLRFADVGPTTRTFQGEQVTIPGISETLFSLMHEAPQGPPASSPDDPNALFSAAPQPAPRLSIDPRTNSVVVQGTRAQIEQVRAIVRELDRPLQMVQIEVIIASADIGVVRELGLALRGSILNDDGSPASVAFDTGVGPDGVGNPPPGGDVFDITGLDALNLLPNAPTAASFVIRGGEVALQAQLAALAQENRARILSAPRLVTIDNLTARITRARNIFVQVDTRLEDSASGGVGLEEIQTGLTLEITPSIVPAETSINEALVRLNLRAENSAPGSGAFGQIDVRSQEVQTNVLVPDGATFVVGGLFNDNRFEGEDGVPVLKDVPVIGGLFRTTSRQASTTETVFFITPRIVTEQTVLSDDIAVRVGSQEYIDRQRRLLSSQYGSDPSMTGYGPVDVDVMLLQEDE